MENQKEKIKKRIKKINGAMSQEGMPLSEEDINILIKCINGSSTYEEEKQKIIERCKKKNGKSL